MKTTRFLSPLAGLFTVCMLVMGSILGGCAESTTAPDATDDNAPVVDATVKTSDPVPSSEADSVRTNVERNQSDTIVVQMDEVIVIALREYPDAEVLGVDLDYDRDTLNYEAIVRSNGKVYVVVISPKDGRVVSKREISEHYYTQVIVIRTIVVKVKQAKERAVKVVKGDVVEVNIENVEDRPTYIIIILTSDNRYVTVYVDAETGKERKLKDGGECEKEGKKKKGRGHYRHGKGKGKGHGHHYHCHCDCDDDDDDGDDDDPTVPSGIISVDSVRTIVNASIDSLTISKIELKVQNDTTAHYEVKASRDSAQYEIKLDAFTGSLMSIRQTGGDMDSTDYQPMVAGDTLVAMSVARTAALAQLAGTLQSWKLEYDMSDKKWLYTFEIKVQATGEVKEVVVDAKTGAFVTIK